MNNEMLKNDINLDEVKVELEPTQEYSNYALKDAAGDLGEWDE